MNNLIVVATLEVAHAILLEATLSFLGLGVQPPTPSWGRMLFDGRGFVTQAWWMAVFPGAAIFLTVLALMFVVRPVNVAASTAGSDLNSRERAFIAWLAPRGIVAAAVSSLFALRLEENGHESLHTASIAALRAFAPYAPLPPDFPDEQLVILLGLHYPAWKR